VSERSTFWSLYVVSLRAFAGSVRFSRTIFAEISSAEAKPLLMPPLPHSSPGKTTALARWSGLALPKVAGPGTRQRWRDLPPAD
jgi:hypothetical protein